VKTNNKSSESDHKSYQKRLAEYCDVAVDCYTDRDRCCIPQSRPAGFDAVLYVDYYIIADGRKAKFSVTKYK